MPAVDSLAHRHAAARLIDGAPGRPLRVVMACDSEDPSGVGMHMLTLADELRAEARLVLGFTRAPAALGWTRRALASGIEAVGMPVAAMQGGGIALIGLLQEFRPDIVHAHAGIGWEGHGIARAARQAGVPVVIRTEHLPYTLRPLKRPALEQAYARDAALADKIICVSNAARATFRMGGLEAARYVTVHNGIRPAAALRTRAAVRRQLGIGAAPLVITVARLTEQKRHHVLLQAFHAVLGRQPDARLLLVGSGPLESRLKQQAHSLAISHAVFFLGQRTDVPDLLSAADLFCLPSHFEGHPLVLMEAMAAGLPVVASRSLGITEVVANGETGILVPFDDSRLLAAALGRLLGDAPLASRLGSNGRRLVRDRFCATRMAAALLAVYRECLATRVQVRLRSPARTETLP